MEKRTRGPLLAFTRYDGKEEGGKAQMSENDCGTGVCLCPEHAAQRGPGGQCHHRAAQEY